MNDLAIAGHSRQADRARARRSVVGGLVFDDVIFAGVILLLAWAPFWFGGDRPLAMGINVMGFGLLLVARETYLAGSGQRQPVAVRRIWPAALAVLLVILWSLVQIAPGVPKSLHHPIWRLAEENLGFPVTGSISINRDATALAILGLVTNACAFWLALQVCRSQARAHRLIQAVALIALGYALYGLIAFVWFPGTILWFAKQAYVEQLTSTFVNRNSFATYAAIGMIASTAAAIASLSKVGVQSDYGRSAAALVAAITGPAGFWLTASLVIAASLFLSGSRAGIACGLGGLLILTAIPVVQQRGRAYLALIGIPATAIVLIAGVLVFGDQLAGRLNQSGFQAGDRFLAYALVLTAIRDHPLLGTGFGTFDHVFPMYRDAAMEPFGRWDKAHNEYLESVLGLGIPIAAAFFCGLAVLVARCIGGVVQRQQYTPACSAAVAASVTVLTHASVDFSLQMPGVGLTYCALLGAGVAQSWSRTLDTSA